MILIIRWRSVRFNDCHNHSLFESEQFKIRKLSFSWYKHWDFSTKIYNSLFIQQYCFVYFLLLEAIMYFGWQRVYTHKNLLLHSKNRLNSVKYVSSQVMVCFIGSFFFLIVICHSITIYCFSQTICYVYN